MPIDCWKDDECEIDSRFDRDTLKFLRRKLRFPDIVQLLFDNRSVMSREEVLLRGLYELQRILVENGQLIGVHLSFRSNMCTIFFYILCMSKHPLGYASQYAYITTRQNLKVYFVVPIVFMYILFSHVKIVLKFKMHLIITNYYCGNYRRRRQ